MLAEIQQLLTDRIALVKNNNIIKIIIIIINKAQIVLLIIIKYLIINNLHLKIIIRKCSKVNNKKSIL